MPDSGIEPAKVQEDIEKNDKEDEKECPKGCIGRLKIGLGLYLLSIALILTWISISTYFSNNNDNAIHIFIYVAVAGGLGATIASMIAFSGRVDNESFSANYIWWYIFRPPIGIVLGVISYMLVVGGLLGLSSSNYTGFTTPELDATLFIIALVFIAGFASKQVSNKIKELSSTLFAVQNTTDTTKDKEQDKQ